MQRAAGSRGAGKKTALGAAFQRQIAAEVEALIGPQALEQLDFEAIETAARREALKLAAYAVAQRLNADHADHCGPSLPCACGQLARYAGRHRKTIQTALGTMTLERAYYHCAACQRGYFPRDAALGIVATALSPALTRMIGLVGAMVSFEEGAELLGALAGIGINAKQVERTAEACWRGCGNAAFWGWARICPMPWGRCNEQGASSIDAKAGARGDGSVATDQCCIVTLTLLPAFVVATMPAYGPKLLARARSWRTWPTLEPFHQRPLIGWLQPFGRRGGVAVHRPSCEVPNYVQPNGSRGRVARLRSGDMYHVASHNFGASRARHRKRQLPIRINA